MKKSLWVRVLVLMMMVAQPVLAVVRPGELAPDANHDGKPDVENILGIISYLLREGVVYDDRDPGGHVPVRRADGKFHMVCVDLLTVCYRNAGYEFGGLNDSFGTGRGRSVPSSRFRQCVNLQQRVMTDPRFHWYPGPGVNPLVAQWKPAQRFRVGDMIFVSYSDDGEHHAGIVTSVDARNGLPSTVTQITSYAPGGGIHRSTWREFFWLKCRTLTGWARPAAWDATPPCEMERSLTAIPPASVDANPKWLGTGIGLSSNVYLMNALDKVRASRRGIYSQYPSPVPEASPLWDNGVARGATPLTLGPRNRHATHFFQ